MKNLRNFVFFILLLPLQLFSFYLDDLGNKELLENDFSSKAALFGAYAAADVYGDDMVKLFLKLRGFKDIQLIDDDAIGMQAIVAYKEIDKKKVLLISFRGTEFFSLNDIFSDINIKESNFLDTDVKVHNGFYTSLNDFIIRQDKVVVDNHSLKEIINNRDDYRIFITGHSLGGAIATLYGAYLYEKGIKDFIVYTFGAPGVGDEEFVKRYSGKFTLYRIINRLDPIPYSTFLPGFYHIGNRIVFNKEGQNISQDFEKPKFNELGIGEHTISNYIDHLKIAYFDELLKDKIAGCNTLKVQYKGLFYCSEKKDLFYPTVLDICESIGGTTLANILFNKDSKEFEEKLKLGSAERISYEKKALESFVLIDSTGFFKDEELMSVLLGDGIQLTASSQNIKRFIDESKGVKEVSKLLKNYFKMLVVWTALHNLENEATLENVIGKTPKEIVERVIKYPTLIAVNNIEASWFSPANKVRKAIEQATLATIKQLQLFLKKEFNKDVNFNIKEIESRVYSSFKEFDLYATYTSKALQYKAVLKSFSEYVKNHEIDMGAALTNFTKSGLTALAIVSAPFMEYAQYVHENIKKKKIVLNLLKPYISQESFEYIYKRLSALEYESISAMYLSYYTKDGWKVAKLIYDTLSMSADLAKGMQSLAPNMLNFLGKYASKISNNLLFKVTGVFFNQYDLLKNESAYKDLVGAAAVSSSLSRYFLKGYGINKILADLLMINSQKLFNASRYWTGSYKDIEKLSGKVGAFIDVAGSFLSEGTLGLLDNKFVSTYFLTNQIDAINKAAGDNVFEEINKIYLSFYSEMMNFRKELITGESWLPKDGDINNTTIFYKDSLVGELYQVEDKNISQFVTSSENGIEVRYYLEDTKPTIWDITYQKDTAPNYDWIEYELVYEPANKTFSLNKIADGTYRETYHPFKNDGGYLFLAVAIGNNDKSTKSIHLREYRTNIDYIVDLSDALAKNIAPQRSDLQEVREAIYYDNGGYSTQFNLALQNGDILAYRFNFLEGKPIDDNWMIIKRNPIFTYTVFYGANSNDFYKIEIPYIATFYDGLSYEFRFPRNVIAIKTGNIWALNQFTLEWLLDYALENYTNSDVIEYILEDIKGDSLSVFTDLNKLSLDKDSDGDGWTDIYESLVGTDPYKADTDGDEIIDSEDPNPLKDTSGIRREKLILNLKDIHPLANPKLYNSKIVYITNKQADSPYDDLYIVIGDKEIKIDSIYEKYANSDLTKNFKLDVIGNVALVSYRKRGDSFNIAVVDLKSLKILKVLDENEISYEIFKSLLYNDYIYSSTIDTLYIYDGLEKAFVGYKLTDFFNTPTLDKLDSISYQNSLTQTKLEISPLSYKAYQDKLFVIVGDYEGYKFEIYDLKNLTSLKSLSIPQELGIESKYHTISIYPASSNKAYFIFNGVLYEYADSITKLANIDGKIVGVENGVVTIYQDNQALHFDTATKKLIAIKKISFASVNNESLKVETIEADSGAILALSNAGVAYSDIIGISDNPQDISNSTQETQNSTDNSCKGLSEISCESGPHVVGEIDTYDANGIVITGEYIYIADGRKGLKIYDKNFQLLGELKIGGIARRVVVRNNYAYIAAHLGGVRVVDVTNPYQPVEVSSLVTYDAFDIALRGDYLYVADSFGGIKVIDIKDPYNPKIVESIATEDYVVSLDIEKNLLFAALGREGLSIFDLNNSVQLIGSLKTDGIAMDVKTVGNYGYLACGKDGIAYIDVSNPKKPVLLSKIKANYAVNLSIQNSLLFVADGSYGVKVFNIEDNMKPRLISLTKTGNAQFITVENKYAYVIDDKKSIKVIDYSEPKQLALVANISLPVLAMDVKVYKDFLYIAGYKEYIQYDQNVWNGFWGVDIHQVEQPKITSSLHLDFSDFDSVYGIDVDDNYIYTVDGDQEIRVISVKEPEDPQIVRNIYDEKFDDFEDIVIKNGVAYLVGTEGFAILDLQNMNIISRLEIKYCNRIKIWNNYAFIATDFDGIKVIDISDPHNPKITCSIGNLKFVKSIAISNNYLYAIKNFGVFVIDIYNLKHPSIVAFLKMDSANDVEVLGKHLFVADGKSGLKIVDISLPYEPRLIAQIDTDNAYKIRFSSFYPNYVFLVDKEGGIKIIDWKKLLKNKRFESNHRTEIISVIKQNNMYGEKVLSLEAFDEDNDSVRWVIGNFSIVGTDVNISLKELMKKDNMNIFRIFVSDGIYSTGYKKVFAIYPDKEHQVTSNFFKDMESYKISWPEAYESVYNLLNRGIIKGEIGSDGVYYYPQREASKLEFAKVFVKSVCSKFDGSSDFVNECLSSLGYSGIVQKPLNIDKVNDDVKDYAIVAYNLGVFGDVATTPYVNFGDKISRVEVARFLDKVLNLEYVSDMDNKLKAYSDTTTLSLEDQIAIQLVNYYRYMRGDGEKFYPLDSLNRVQLAVIANRLLNRPTIEQKIKEERLNVSSASVRVENGTVYVGEEAIFTYEPKDANITVMINGEPVESYSKMPRRGIIEIVVERNGVRSSQRYGFVVVNNSDQAMEKESDNLDELDELLNIGPKLLVDRRKIVLHPDQTTVVHIYVDSSTGSDLIVDVNSSTGVLQIKRNWANPVKLAEYSDGNLSFTVSFAKEIQESNDTLVVSVTDDSGYVEREFIDVTIVKNGEIYFPKGWSLKALPTNKSVNVSSVLANALIVWKYNSGNWQGWSSKDEYLQLLQQHYDVFKAINPAEGFWIYSQKESLVKVGNAQAYDTANWKLKEGWNLVGVSKEFNTTSLPEDVRFVWVYRDKEWLLWSKEGDFYDKYRPLNKILPNEGCWVYKPFYKK